MQRDFFAPADVQAANADRITADNEAPLGRCGNGRTSGEDMGCNAPLVPGDWEDRCAGWPGCILP